MDTREIKFISSIDCNMPYNDMARCKEIIREAINISSNAVFSVMLELCHLPQSKLDDLIYSNCNLLLSEISKAFTHPLIPIAMLCCKKIINHEQMEQQEARAVLNSIKPYKGQYALLNLISLSAEDGNGLVEAEIEVLKNQWKEP